MDDRLRADYRRAANDLLAASAQPIERLRLQVISDSMRPVLQRGDVVLVEPIESATIRVGEVLVVQRGAELITHRLIDLSGEQWVLRGDNAIFADTPIRSASCLGRVIAIERGARQIDLTRSLWPSLNDRLGRVGRAHWRVTRRLRLSSSSSRWQIRLAWLVALPFRVTSRLMLIKA